MKKTSGFEGYFFKYSSWSYWLINNLRKILKIKKKMIAHAHTGTHLNKKSSSSSLTLLLFHPSSLSIAIKSIVLFSGVFSWLLFVAFDRHNIEVEILIFLEEFSRGLQ